MYSLSRKVAVSDIGPDKKMTVPRLVAALGDCEQFQIENTPGFREFYQQNNLGIYLSSRQADIILLPAYAEEITVTTYVYELNRFYGVRNTFVYGQNGGTLAKSYAVGANVDLRTGQPARVPESFAALFVKDEKQQMDYLPRKISLPDSAPEKLPPLTVPGFFIDFYGHVNNVHYITLALESLGNPKNIKRVRAEYKAAAISGEKIFPRVYRAGSVYTVSLQNGAGGVFANVEITV